MEELKRLIYTLACESGGGGEILETLAALGPEQYEALVNLFRAFGVIPLSAAEPPATQSMALPPFQGGAEDGGDGQ